MPPMTDSLAPRRAMCAHCLRPQSTCICGWVTRVDSEVEVLVLMHPMEVANAKNSGRLLHLCLPNSALVVGEAFDAATLESLLFAGARQPVLLYPAGEGAPALPGPDDGVPTRPERLRLVALDATWRKSRKMLHLNPLLVGWRWTTRRRRLITFARPTRRTSYRRSRPSPMRWPSLKVRAYANRCSVPLTPLLHIRQRWRAVLEFTGAAA
jgi:hypothetical protein